MPSAIAPSPSRRALATRGAFTVDLPWVREPRGSLVFGEISDQLPFQPRRFWTIFDVPAGERRGGHAHRTLQEFLVCGRGGCRVTLDDGTTRTEVVLDRPDLGLYIPALTWTTQQYFSAGTYLLVVASEVYRPDDYVRDHDAFLALCAGARTTT